ncbi:MAG: hypothetical protein AMXMBFR13_08370 [Phycisphaerae bacterium]
MPDTIQAFVGRLQAEGVEAGRQAAAKIEAEAEERAARVLREAETKASEIRAQAETDAAGHRNRTEGELRMAVRDTVLALRETLGRMLHRVILARVEAQLSDDAFLRDLILEVLRQYARADGEGRSDIRISLTPETQRQLAQWAVQELRQELSDHTRRVDLNGTLEKAGFEYRLTGGTVEVTSESVAGKLHELARPELRNLLDGAAEATSGRGNGEAVQVQGSRR